jgi:hypothetical protein
MDRRVLIAVALVAMLIAVMLFALTAPDTGATARASHVSSKDEPVVAAVAPGAQRQPAPPNRVTPKVVGAASERLVWDPTTPREDFGVQPIDVRQQTDPEAQRQYRCRALGQQSDLVDKLMVVGGGAGVDETQRADMVSRVATLSTRIFEEGEHLWSGDLSCEGISQVNLGQAADFLAKNADELELDDKARTEINQALGVLDSVDWNNLP